MHARNDRQIARGFWATSLGTLASRVLGLARDMTTAAILGLGQGGVMDALVLALRLPNFTRRVLGEGALAASLLPVLAKEREESPRQAWRLLSVLLALLTILLAGLVLVGEAACYLGWLVANSQHTLLIGLTATLLPYLLFICLAAQIAATLQTLGEFRWPAIAPALLNVCWLAAAWLVAPHWAGDRQAQAYVIAVAVLVAGVLQLAVLVVPLYRAGFRFEFGFHAAAPAVWQVMRSMPPVALALAVTQINLLVDSLLAVTLAAEAGSRQPIAWLGGWVAYPLETGAAAAIYYGERFYQLPVGVLGLAIATVVYPSLARHAARGDRPHLGSDLTTGLRLVWFLALPAGVGLMLTAEPIIRLVFVRGAFTQHDAQRAAAMVVCYAGAAWAFCMLPVLVRGYFAVGNRTTPLRVGLLAVGVDLLATLTLIWPLHERGLAISTSLAAMVQAMLLVGLCKRAGIPLAWPQFRTTLLKGALATLAMAIMVVGCRRFLGLEGETVLIQSVALTLTIALGMLSYGIAAWLLGMRELHLLWQRGETRPTWASPAVVQEQGG